MIDIAALTEADRGRWVEYSPWPSQVERGRIKHWNRHLVFVVYRCDNHWDQFADYTAAPTLPEYLSFVVEP